MGEDKESVDQEMLENLDLLLNMEVLENEEDWANMANIKDEDEEGSI